MKKLTSGLLSLVLALLPTLASAQPMVGTGDHGVLIAAAKKPARKAAKKKASAKSSKAASSKAAVAPSTSCTIKGNISATKEKIFHVIGCPNYGQTVIDTTKGERMFCSEQEAKDAGWRKALNCP
jgi:hypothetical protein